MCPCALLQPTTEASTCVSNTEDITSESVDNDYATMLDDDLVIDEILVAGTTYYKSINKYAS